MLRQCDRDERAREHPRDRSRPERESEARPEIPVAALVPRTGGDRRQDREQRRRLRLELAQAEGDERGYEQDPAADAEQPGEDPRCEAERKREQDGRGAQGQRSQSPIPVRKSANA